MADELPPMPTGGVAIIGEKKFDNSKVFQLGHVRLHPPMKFSQTWVMLFALMASGSKGSISALAVVNGELIAFLAADLAEVGVAGAPVRIQAIANGTINIRAVQVRNAEGQHDA